MKFLADVFCISNLFGDRNKTGDAMAASLTAIWNIPNMSSAERGALTGNVTKSVILGLITKKMKMPVATKEVPSLGAGRTGVKQWLQNAGSLERRTLIQNIESVGFKRISPTTSPVSVYKRGDMKIRLDPPQLGTPFNHMHLEYGGNSYNTLLNPVNYRSPAAHIPIR